MKKLNMTTTTATNPRPSTTGVRGWDVDVEVHGLYGEVTLAPDQATGRPVAYGDPDMWVSGALLREIEHHARGDRGAIRGTLAAIESAAAAAIEAAGVAPASEAQEEEEATADHACVGCGEPAGVPPGPGEVEWQCRACADAPADE